MSADYIQLLGTDVPCSYGGCCFSGEVQHEALRCPSEPMTLAADSLSSVKKATTAKTVGGADCGQLLLFNCPEGTQRFSSEANLRLVRVRGFFFTRWVVSTVMGMPGLLFTINDAGVRHANFFGPSSYCSIVHSGDFAQISPSVEETNSVGLEGMLEAVRQHYFLHRSMSFQQLCSGTTLRRFATRTPWNYVCEVPLPPPETEEEKTKGARAGETLECRRNLLSSSSSYSSFFVLALLLSPTSALLGFCVSSSGDSSLCEETYGYAILHAPKTGFDPQRAKQFGVPPGPMYGQLKQGTGVWVDDGHSHPSCGSRRFVDPRSVRQATVGSRSLYVSLILDGDNPKDVAVALELLFGRDVIAEKDGERNVDRFGVSAKKCNSSNKRQCGELENFLLRWQPSLLFCDEEHAALDAAAGAAPVERSIVLVHVVHVQPLQFFSKFTMNDVAAAQAHYVSFIFANSRREIREQAVRSYSGIKETMGNHCADAVVSDIAGTTAGATHHFCAFVQQMFSAFPTALAHRYHLNYIAKAQFPISFTSDEEGEGGGNEEEAGDSIDADDKSVWERRPIWPYSLRHLLLPADACLPITNLAQNLSTAYCATGESFVSFSLLSNKALKKREKGNGTGKGQDVSRMLWYPTVRSALGMLSTGFRSAVANAQRHMLGSIRVISSPQSPHIHGPRNHHHLKNNNSVRIDEKNNLYGNQRWKLDGGGALTFLGTGSAVPSKYRNVSGTFLEVTYRPRNGTGLCRGIVVLDFGEGNAGQLAMFWGSDCAEEMRFFFYDLLFVFISHAHADHHFGLLALLEQRNRLRREGGCEMSGRMKEPLLVVCPQEVHDFLQDTWGRCAAYRSWLQKEVTFDVFPAERHRTSEFSAAPVFMPALNALCGRLNDNTAVAAVKADHGVSPELWAAEVFPVDHPANAHALLFRFPAPVEADAVSRVFLFSGDTRPSQFLVERCRQFTRSGCTEHERRRGVFLCLHEATFGEGCEGDAILKCHSTLPEALQVAAAIRAENVVLNHFSQRYPKLPGLMKSQLGGKDVDLHCRRRRPLVHGMVEQSSGNTGVLGLAASLDAKGTPPPLLKQEEHHLPKDTLAPLLFSLRGSFCKESHYTLYEAESNKMCFGFDFMRVSFASLESQQTAQLTPVFIELLEEYESWGVSTSKRLREGQN